MKVIFSLTFALIIILIVSTHIFAQAPAFPVNPTQAPIDGGLGLLAAAGGAYAWKKLRDKKVRENK